MASGKQIAHTRAGGNLLHHQATETPSYSCWAGHDSTEYLDWTKAQRVILPNLKPSLRTISLRLPESVIARLKVLANKRDVPYQSLLKVLLAERLKQEETADRS